MKRWWMCRQTNTLCLKAALLLLFFFFWKRKNQPPKTFLMSSHALHRRKKKQMKTKPLLVICILCSIQICSDDMTSNHPLIETRRPFFIDFKSWFEFTILIRIDPRWIVLSMRNFDAGIDKSNKMWRSSFYFQSPNALNLIGIDQSMSTIDSLIFFFFVQFQLERRLYSDGICTFQTTRTSNEIIKIKSVHHIFWAHSSPCIPISLCSVHWCLPLIVFSYSAVKHVIFDNWIIARYWVALMIKQIRVNKKNGKVQWKLLAV